MLLNAGACKPPITLLSLFALVAARPAQISVIVLYSSRKQGHCLQLDAIVVSMHAVL